MGSRQELDGVTAERLADRLGQLGYQAQLVARQGGAAWFATERLVVATDADGGGYVVPAGDAIPPADLWRVPESQRRLVTSADIEVEHGELEALARELLAAQGDEEPEQRVPGRLSRADALEALTINRRFAERHVAGHVETRRLVRLSRCLRPSSRRRTSRPRVRRAHRARAPGRSSADPSEPAPLALRLLLALDARVDRFARWLAERLDGGRP